ncbi:2-hydroxyacid dehydrogenase [Glutamicibacter protophormiae]|uniref:2-hydroxyacid dehydrogenase n=1 Tax=Glutamicibacter protophormiae TaxID=37930 RepID=UPI003A910AAA
MPTNASAQSRPAHPPISGDAILQVGPVNPAVAQSLSRKFGALELPDAGPAREALLEARGAQIRVAVCSGRVGVDTELMLRLPRLEAIINFGVGYDATDIELARERGIAVSNTPDVLTNCVADTALGLYLNTLRSLPAAERFVRDGSWTSGQNFRLTKRASGTRVGILGLGRIGQAIAVRLQAFGCEIHYHNRSEKQGAGYTYHSSAVSLAAATDVLMIAAAGGPHSAGLVDREVIEAVGPQGFIINIARGSVIDETALLEALRSGAVAGAGLDVFANEPHLPPGLLELENVVLLPHVGSGTIETRRDMAALTLENLRSYLTDRTLLTPIF